MASVLNDADLDRIQARVGQEAGDLTCHLQAKRVIVVDPDGNLIASVPGHCFTPALLRGLWKAHQVGRERGEAEGRRLIQTQFLNLLGARLAPETPKDPTHDRP